MCYMQLPSGPTRFRSMFVKPYFWPENTYDIKLNELKTTAKLDKLEVTAELDKLKVPLPTLEVPQKPTELTKPIIKRG